MGRTVYLDHAATTPTDSRVVEAMLPYFGDFFGNTSSAHAAGRRAETSVEEARRAIAQILNCEPDEIVFTSGGTESDNLAVRGVALARADRGHHLIISSIEHSAVTRTVEQLVDYMGFQTTILEVDRAGRVMPETLSGAITTGTTFASVMYANNEIGTIQPIAELATQAHAHGIVFHTDAVQAPGQLDLDVQKLGVDLLSISAHKFYGPKGVGALYVRRGLELVPSQTGGSHEVYRRAGTLNTPGIIGMARALALAHEERDARTAHYRRLRDQIIDGVIARIPGAYLTGDPVHRLPNHASFVFDDVDANTLLMHLDLKGVQASSASACKTGSPEPSAVLLALGYPPEMAKSSLRLTVGRFTTSDEIEYALDALEDAIARVRKIRRPMQVSIVEHN
ncbi:MAG: cysteine desulfurase [Anaerolinea sp.]|nr:cysteine desulfurase [Anaerolinea sp.]